MKLALITGPLGFPLVREFHLGYHLVLAHKCLEDPSYLSFYQTLRDLGHFIILDNGAAEMQSSIPFERVMEVAARLQPDEIVMPDELGNGDATMTYFDSWENEVPLRKRMGVPQGRSWDEWRNCLHHMLRAGVHTIGVAKRYEAFAGGRLSAVKYFMEQSDHGTPYYETVDTHLLGCYSNPIWEIMQMRSVFDSVRGIDTAAPFAHAQANLGMGKDGRYGHIGYAWNEPFNEDCARHNITEVLQTCTSL